MVKNNFECNIFLLVCNIHRFVTFLYRVSNIFPYIIQQYKKNGSTIYLSHIHINRCITLSILAQQIQVTHVTYHDTVCNTEKIPHKLVVTTDNGGTSMDKSSSPSTNLPCQRPFGVWSSVTKTIPEAPPTFPHAKVYGLGLELLDWRLGKIPPASDARCDSAALAAVAALVHSPALFF
jgi:hypothetical protein